jgi:hypothetical protein
MLFDPRLGEKTGPEKPHPSFDIDQGTAMRRHHLILPGVTNAKPPRGREEEIRKATMFGSIWLAELR